MGSEPKVILQKVIAMMNIVVGDKWQSYIIFGGHVMDHGQKVHLHFIKRNTNKIVIMLTLLSSFNFHQCQTMFGRGHY
jgi:hypothetical protein